MPPVGFEPTNSVEDGFTDRLLYPLAYRGLITISERRDSNSRHQAWKACVLPTELHSQMMTSKTALVIEPSHHVIRLI